MIYWADETAVKEDANWMRGFAPAGPTPVLEMPACWDKRSMISAITHRREIIFQIVEDTINAERFIEFLAGLIQDAPASDNDDDLLHKAQRIMQRIAEIPGGVQFYFQHLLAAYAALTGYLRAGLITACGEHSKCTKKFILYI